MNETTLIIIVLIVAIVIAAVVYFGMRKRNSTRLESRFGPEYARTVDTVGDRGKAEAELLEREKRVKKFEIKPLTEDERRAFAERWQAIQTKFVDNPNQAVAEADALTVDVMTARGYPMSDFEQRASDISVDHPQVVENYRAAHDIALRNAKDDANTEDLRRATVSYRALFQELVGDGDTPSARADAAERVEAPAESATPIKEEGKPV